MKLCAYIRTVFNQLNKVRHRVGSVIFEEFRTDYAKVCGEFDDGIGFCWFRSFRGLCLGLACDLDFGELKELALIGHHSDVAVSAGHVTGEGAAIAQGYGFRSQSAGAQHEHR